MTDVTPVAATSGLGSQLELAGEGFRKKAVFCWRKVRKLLARSLGGHLQEVEGSGGARSEMAV